MQAQSGGSSYHATGPGRPTRCFSAVGRAASRSRCSILPSSPTPGACSMGLRNRRIGDCNGGTLARASRRRHGYRAVLCRVCTSAISFRKSRVRGGRRGEAALRRRVIRRRRRSTRAQFRPGPRRCAQGDAQGHRAGRSPGRGGLGFSRRPGLPASSGIRQPGSMPAPPARATSCSRGGSRCPRVLFGCSKPPISIGSSAPRSPVAWTTPASTIIGSRSAAARDPSAFISWVGAGLAGARRSRCRNILSRGSPDGPRSMTATAWVVRGRVR